MVIMFYNQYNEDLRLTQSRAGQLEFATTINCIHQFVAGSASIAEIGAGTGQYSIALAKEGHIVTAIDLVKHNCDIIRQKSKKMKNFNIYQEDALDLSRFMDCTFDLTLVLGPLYHLFTKQDQNKALDEAIRITKNNGIIMVSFLSAHANLFTNYLQGNLYEGIEENFTKEYSVKHFTEQIFTTFDVIEFENLFKSKPVNWITTVATDSVLELAEKRSDFVMTDDDFMLFAEYHMKNCEKRELLGSSNHLLYICRRKETLY